MKLVIAEKPSVATSIAKVIGSNIKKDGYYEGNGYKVSWCIGHLVKMVSPEEYGEKYKKWDIEDLPIVPINYKYEVDEKTKKQFNILKNLMNSKEVDTIINACDSGREGELIFRLVYNQVDCTKKVKRLWISSMEDNAIKNGFENLKNEADYNNLFESAKARAIADWLVGINISRFYSSLYKQNYSIGRVQTPTLAMIVERDNEIDNFKKEKFYSLEIKTENFTLSTEKIDSIKIAEKLRNLIPKTIKINEIVEKEKITKPNKLYDLTTLQREANKLYGYSAKQTLDYLQSLYEKKMVTYPRTDSKYLTEDMKETIKILINKLDSNFTLDINNYNSIFNNSKVSDHYAIIPTISSIEKNLLEIPESERKIYELIKTKLLMACSSNLNVAFNEAYLNEPLGIDNQNNFFNNFINPLKERVVVIISDALRYEVGKTLFDKLEDEQKTSCKIYASRSFIPSITKFGMSALLPHKQLSINNDLRMLVDDKICEDLKSREAILNKYISNSKALNFDDIKNMKISELRDVFSGQQLVYIYHNQIDARGDKLNTENEVFDACEEAINEILTIIKRLGSANNTRVFITSDHGFIYKRSKVLEQNKISNLFTYNINKRYIISDDKINKPGVFNIPISDLLNNDDERFICLPKGIDIFKVAGGGQNFVHGGSSIQETIIPIIDVKINRGNLEVRNAKIELVSLLNKVTNLNINLEFIQKEPISDIIKETTYKVYFVDENNNKISNECNYFADKKDNDAIKRIFKLKFNFRNMQYDIYKKYYLVIYDNNMDNELSRQEVKIDLLFTDDFNF